jgi:hypothetical protein
VGLMLKVLGQILPLCTRAAFNPDSITSTNQTLPGGKSNHSWVG